MDGKGKLMFFFQVLGEDKSVLQPVLCGSCRKLPTLGKAYPILDMPRNLVNDGTQGPWTEFFDPCYFYLLLIHSFSLDRWALQLSLETMEDWLWAGLEPCASR